jgi:hypothetical protein
MKRSLMLTAAVACLLFGTVGPLQAYRDGYYTSGIIKSTQAPDKIVIGTRTFTVSPKCDIVFQLRKGPSIYEKHATFYDISAGDPVFVKIEGSTVKNVCIERWKQ